MTTLPQQQTTQLKSTVSSGQEAYYNYPALKEIEWGWQVILYLFFGGLAAGAYVVATLADIFGTAEDRPVARAGRFISLGAIVVSPLLLIADLGRRERFTHMLRIVKSRSPMSMGTWGLSAFGLFAGLGALRQAVEDGRFRPGSPPVRLLAWFPPPFFGLVGSAFSFFVSSYPGVLLSFTNVPLWAKNRFLQAPLFIASALSTGLAAISLAIAGRRDVSPRTEAWLGQAETAANLSELGLAAGALATLGPVARPLYRRPYAAPFWLGWVGLGLVLPLVLRLWTRGDSESHRLRRKSIASLCVLGGGLAFRAVTVLAGRESARDARAYFATGRNRSGRV